MCARGATAQQSLARRATVGGGLAGKSHHPGCDPQTVPPTVANANAWAIEIPHCHGQLPCALASAGDPPDMTIDLTLQVNG